MATKNSTFIVGKFIDVCTAHQAFARLWVAFGDTVQIKRVGEISTKSHKWAIVVGENPAQAKQLLSRLFEHWAHRVKF